MECGEIKIIKVHAGQTYFYDGKYLVKTTQPHTSEDRYVTLKAFEQFTIITDWEVIDLDDQHIVLGTINLGSEFWGEIDRCHMVRKTPVKSGSVNDEKIIITEKGIINNIKPNLRVVE